MDAALAARAAFSSPSSIHLAPSAMDACLESEHGTAALLAFCQAEFSEENLLFCLKAREFVARWDGRSDEERQSTADALVSRFLADGAPQQVCVGRADEFASSLATLSKEMFAPAVEVARAALALDIWPRFEETDDWRRIAATL